jgi:hypothetical protein
MHPLTFIVSILLSGMLVPAYASDIRQFDFGNYHRCSLGANGTVDCLGENNRFGQIGYGGSDEQGSPRPVRVIPRGARKVVTGNFYTCAIVGDALQCWGDIPPNKGNTRKPVTLIKKGVSDIAAGSDRVCAIVRSAVQCIGMGGRTGSREYLEAHPTPETVIASGASAISAGDHYACAVVEAALWCWGRVPSYAIRENRRGDPLPPIRVIEHGVSMVAAGKKHVCAIVDGATDERSPEQIITRIEEQGRIVAQALGRLSALLTIAPGQTGNA